MSMFTRRHYIWLASVARDMRREIKDTTDSIVAREATDSAIGVLANALENEGGGFDRKRFIKVIYDDPTDMTPHALILEHNND